MTKIITTEEIEENAVASLPTRPTESVSFGGKGYTSAEMKAAFDRLPTLIAKRLNSLILDIEGGEVLANIPTGIEAMPTLKALIDGVENERFASAMAVFGMPLNLFLLQLRADVDKLMEKSVATEADA